MYKGLIRCTKDTGKKIKGRPFNEFIKTSDENDEPLEYLKSDALIRKTVLYYSAAKFVDRRYNFTQEEILDAIDYLNKF